jgi:iron(III) transport system ATP-binding protein
VIAGVTAPTRGRLSIGGVEVAGPERFIPPEARNVGIVFQDSALFPHMTVLENVMYGLYAVPKSDARRAAESSLKRVNMLGFADRLPASLSGGEQQRVALARAIVPRPQVMLLDEPFSGLDQRLRDEVRADTVAIIRETGATAILVTHDPTEALDVADRIFLMRAGQLVQNGSPREMYEQPVDAKAARFFSSYNELAVRARNGRAATPIGIFDAPVTAVEGTAVDVLIRPSAIRPGTGANSFAALVRDSQFMGERQRLTLLVEGVEQPLTAMLPTSAALQVGHSGRFVVEPSGVFVFTTPAAHTT